ncbi:flagellar biosynthesis anti-sigma factor FlgM [Planktomarina temperata]|nr:flagellar biosynthesis anti-sigma factor FlgM [Planktomarina temperata]
MVDSIKHNMRQMLVPGAQDAKAAPPRGGQAAADVTEVSAGYVDASSLSIKASVSALVETPPIDIEVVSRIKQQIEAGKYPVNLDLVSERLMESYLEMKG